MGERNRDRQLREARVTYVGAVARFRRTLAAFDDSGMPMDPGPDETQPHPWTREQVAIIQALRVAVDDLTDARRSWDRLRREWRTAHG